MLLASLLLLCAQTPPLEFVKHPVDGQLYPRNAQNTAEIELTGWVHQAGWQRILVVAKRDGIPFSAEVQNLTYSGGQAGFDLSVSIHAERHAYSLHVLLMNGLQMQQVAEAHNVVAGDVFLIQGQSNAVAADGFQEGLANREQSPWIRSFGTGSITSWQSAGDVNWYLADGESQSAEGSIGAWGLRMGRLLVDQTDVPVAILNGAVGATPIKMHMRNDANPSDTSTIYGRLLNRARNAGVDQHVRAIIWHQGESDSARALNYREKFPQLHADWLEDFPAVEQVYMFQVRNGCGNPTVELREVQRRLKDFLPITQVMSTTAAPAHDGCHYYHVGYQELGNRIARLVGRDLYGSGDTQNIDAPDIESASYANMFSSSIRITFRDPDDTLHFDPGAAQDFVLDDGISVTGGVVSGNTILLSLSGPSSSRTLSYVGHAQDGAWITNARGIGALAFKVLIRP